MRTTVYLWILGISITIVFCLNAFLINTGIGFGFIVLCGFLNPILIFGLDAAVAAAIHALPAKWFDPYEKRYQPLKIENSIYRRIRINAWKDYVPDTGKLTTGLSKSEITGTDTDYLHLFLVETCYAETIHVWMALTGLIPVLFITHSLLWSMLIPHALINFFLNIPPILIQRNNRPKLIRLYERNLRNRAG